MSIYEPYAPVTSNPHKGKFKPRDEQRDAIDKAFKYFAKCKGKGGEFLWNAKMRFGKTVSALWLIERLYKEQGKHRVLIVTHRPIVNASWYGDFTHLFQDDLAHYSYGTARETDDETTFEDFYDIKRDAAQGKCVIFFASMQYLRLAKIIRGIGQDSSKVKEDILNYDWDLVIIDEAHEGTQTNLGEGVINYLHKGQTLMLHLSGTPFNLLDKFKGEQIYNWDYIKEQQTKQEWDENQRLGKHGPDEVNPYRELPKMAIMTFRIGEMTDEQAIKDLATGKFSFSEFFRVKTGLDLPKEERGRFVHESEVLRFLEAMWKPGTDYPFSTQEYQNAFRHTLWVVPGVKEARALKTLIETRTPLPKWGFKVVNVAGNNEDDELRENALDKVFDAMKIDPIRDVDDSDQTRTITLSCGRLTTGVTVRPWTAVLYMKGSETTSASTYMQTIFRVQSPHVLHGRMKSCCFVFDFAPERALIMMAETAKFSRAFEKKEKKGERKQKAVIDREDKEKMRQLLATCPVYETREGCPIIVNGVMKPIEPERLFSQLTHVYVDKVVRNGFDDPNLYNNDELLKLELEDEANLNYVSTVFDDATSHDKDKGKGKQTVDVNHQSLTPAQREALKKEKEEREKAARAAREKAKKQYAEKLANMTPEEREKFLKAKEDHARKLTLLRQSRKKLTGLSKRIPLMMYGANVRDFEEVTLDNFTDKRFIDDASWNEFMPNGITRSLFKKLTRFYNADVFRDAGVRIRQLAREADAMTVEDRIDRIAWIFKWFKNPDTETVLTPWEVVNRHMASTLGGYCFFEDDFKTPVTKTDPVTGEVLDTHMPRFVDRGEVTKEVFGDGSFGNIDELQGKINTRILEINSKTGLYPLYVAYSLYRHLLPVYAKLKGLMADNPDDYSAEDEQVIWDEVVKNNLYVICNTPMAERITRRTLLGFRTNKDGSEIKLHVKQDKLIARVKEDREKLISDLLDEGYWNNDKHMKGNKLKFNAVVGNPPYQEEGLNTRKAPIYHLFYDLAFDLSDKATLITPGRFLFKAGQTPKEWMEKILNDKHFKVVDYFQKSMDIFPSVDIKGGIAITYHDANADFGRIQLFSSYSELREILGKVINFDGFEKGKFAELISSQGLYKFTEALFEDYPRASEVQGKGTASKITSNSFENLPEVFLDDRPNDIENYIQIIGRSKNQRILRWINKSYIQPVASLPFYRVFVPEANGTGAIGEVLSTPIIGTPIIGTPMIGHTDTFLSIGMFKTEEEANSCLKYVCSKFARTMLGTLKATQHNPRDTWAYVPMQDFTSKSDIDWSKPIPDIDQQLYRKYKLSPEEIDFIETKIKPMD